MDNPESTKIKQICLPVQKLPKRKVPATKIGDRWKKKKKKKKTKGGAELQQGKLHRQRGCLLNGPVGKRGNAWGRVKRVWYNERGGCRDKIGGKEEIGSLSK